MLARFSLFMLIVAGLALSTVAIRGIWGDVTSPSEKEKARGPRGAYHDFDGDRRSDLVWISRDGPLSIWYMDGTAVRETSILPMAAGDSVVGIGDFNNDRRSDVLVETSLGATELWILDGRQAALKIKLAENRSWLVAATGDFNGDGSTDIVWRNNEGIHVVWLMDGIGAKEQAALGGSAEWRLLPPTR